jgi:alpha-ketoglutarate-dependent taurine dioxygenase
MNPINSSTSTGKTFARVKPKGISMDGEGLASSGLLLPDSQLPYVYCCTAPQISLAHWASQRSDELNRELLTHGGILFRGFSVSDAADFRDFAAAVARELVEYNERSSPRSEITSGVYTSTDHPPDQPIVMHNEQSYNLRWPLKILFYCKLAAAQGGRTPIADSRQVLHRLPDIAVERFRDQGVLYVRNYNGGLGLTWQQTFQTDDPEQVER